MTKSNGLILFRTSDYKYLVLIAFIIFLCYLSLLRVDDYFYADDNIRKSSGGAYFKHLSRYLSEYLAYSFTIPFNKFFTISPLPQVLAVIILSFAGGILVKVFTDEFTVLKAIAASIIGVYPFFYHNILYSFDAVFMGLSVLFAIIPLLAFNNLKLFSILTIVCTVVVLTTYQSSSGIFPALVIILLLQKYFVDRISLINSVKIFLAAFISYFIAILLFRFFIYKEFNGHISTEALSIIELIPGIIKNSVTYLAYTKEMLGNNYILYFSIFVILYVVIRYTLEAKQKYLAVVVISVMIVISFVITAGLPILMKEYHLQIRYLIGINAYFAVLTLILVQYGNKLFKFFTVLFVINLLAIGNIMGNIINDQWQYDKFRITVGISELVPLLTNEYKISFSGNPTNKVSFNQYNGKYPVLEALIYGRSNLNIYGKEKIFSRYLPLSRGAVTCESGRGEIISSTVLQNIYKNGSCYHLEFR